MQPAAADVEGDVGRGLDGMRPPADAVARLQHDDGEAGILQRIRGAKAGGARADDGNIDGGGEGATCPASSTIVAAPEATPRTTVVTREGG